jgi:hypothetical protein
MDLEMGEDRFLFDKKLRLSERSGVPIDEVDENDYVPPFEGLFIFGAIFSYIFFALVGYAFVKESIPETIPFNAIDHYIYMGLIIAINVVGFSVALKHAISSKTVEKGFEIIARAWAGLMAYSTFCAINWFLVAKFMALLNISWLPLLRTVEIIVATASVVSGAHLAKIVTLFEHNSRTQSPFYAIIGIRKNLGYDYQRIEEEVTA